jgi:hypothetical protein
MSNEVRQNPPKPEPNTFGAIRTSSMRRGVAMIRNIFDSLIGALFILSVIADQPS